MLDPYLAIGEITKPQGVRGEVKLRPLTDDLGRFEGLERVYLKEQDVYSAVNVLDARADNESAYLTLEGVSDRDAAEKMRGRLVYIDRAHANPLPEDADYICDLIGCEAVTDEGERVGTLTDVLQPAGNDVYVFRTDKGEMMLPALKIAVLTVDTEHKTMLLSGKAIREMAVYS